MTSPASTLIAAILTDIEGTTTPIAFVHDVLFPYARAHLAAFLAAHAADPEVAAELQAVRDLSPGTDPEAALLGWMAEDAKITPLKALQGLVWRQGYTNGTLHAELYPDVAPCLRRWHRAGLALHVYSSGSEAAQRQIFAHTPAGDLTPLFTRFFDTRIGPKRDPESYRRITAAIARPAPSVLFLSDVEQELDAAADAGLEVCQLVRAEDHTTASLRHPGASTFAEVERSFLRRMPALL